MVKPVFSAVNFIKKASWYRFNDQAFRILSQTIIRKYELIPCVLRLSSSEYWIWSARVFVCLSEMSVRQNTVLLFQRPNYFWSIFYCINVLCAILQLSQSTRLRDAVRNDVFPSAESIVCLNREFGIPLTAKHFECNVLFYSPLADH